MKKIIKIITILIFSNLLFVGTPQETKANFFDLGNAAKQAGYTTSTAPNDPSRNPLTKIGIVLGAALNFLGVIFLALMIYGGFLWMTATGNEEQVGKARKVITAAIIGLIIVASAYAITAFVGTNIVKTTTTV